MIEIVKIPLYVTLAIDPAVTDMSWSDHTGITVNGESKDATWYTLKADAFKGQPSDVVDRAVYYALRYKPQIVSCEQIAAQRLYLPNLREAFDKYGLGHISIVGFKYSTRLSKHARISALQPRLKQGKWYFKKGECQPLISQMLRYPETGDEDDLLDAMTHHLKTSRPLREYEIGTYADLDDLEDDEEDANKKHRHDGTWVGRGGSRYAA